MNGVSSWSVHSQCADSVRSQCTLSVSQSQLVHNTWSNMPRASASASPTSVPQSVMQSVHSEHRQCAVSLQFGHRYTKLARRQQTVNGQSAQPAACMFVLHVNLHATYCIHISIMTAQYKPAGRPMGGTLQGQRALMRTWTEWLVWSLSTYSVLRTHR